MTVVLDMGVWVQEVGLLCHRTRLAYKIVSNLAALSGPPAAAAAAAADVVVVAAAAVAAVKSLQVG